MSKEQSEMMSQEEREAMSQDGFTDSTLQDEDSLLKLPLLGLKNEDPEPIKRLKRELQVALAEEDYGAAIRIRDHPFMVLYTEIETMVEAGKDEEAQSLSEQLMRAIEEAGEAED